MAKVIYQIADFDGEKSTTSFGIDSLTNEGTLRSAVDGVSLGVIQQVTEISDVTILSSDNAASQWAQREVGLRVHVSDDVNGESGYFTVACPDLATLTLDTAGDVTLADASVMAALVSAMESHVLSRDGNAITVVRATIVGRNN